MKSMTKLLCLLLCLAMIGGCFVGCDFESTDSSNEQASQPQDGEDQNSTTGTGEWTVTFDANGGAFENGETTTTQTVAQGTRLTVPQTPRRTGYTFSGWSINQNTSEPWDFANATVNRAITLYASWTTRTASVLSVEGATINEREIFLIVDQNTQSVSLSDKVVCTEGCVWKLYRDQMGQIEIPTKIAAGMDGALESGENIFYIVVTSIDGTMTSVYELTVYRSYAVSVNYYHGNELIHTETAYTGYDFSVTYVPSIDGFSFHHWNTEEGTPCDQITPWDTVSLFADATANTYEVTYNVNGGSCAETGSTVTFGERFSFSIPTLAGHDFAGWYYGDTQLTDAYGNSVDVWNIAENVTVTAKWSIHRHNVTLSQNDVNAGWLEGAGTYSYGESITVVANPREGYTFLGWYQEDTLVSENTSYTFTLGDEAVVLTAKWGCYMLTTQKNIEGGTITSYTSSKIVLGTPITLTATTYLGYKWIGWYQGDTLVSEELSYSFEMPAENITLTAKWEVLPEMQPFTFTSNDRSCTVTGLKNQSTSEIRIPSCVTHINQQAFMSNTSLTRVTIDPGATYIGNMAFYNCTKLTSVTIGNGVTYIGEYAFRGCSSLTNVTLPETLISLGICVFLECNSLESITIPFVGAAKDATSNTQFSYLFGGSSYTHNKTNVPSSLKTVVITGGERISDYAFYQCSSLTSVTIGDGIKSIGEYAFSDCSSLTTISIGNDVTSIGKAAFGLCEALKNVYITDLAQWCELEFPTPTSNPMLFGTNLYLNGQLATNITIPDTVTALKDYVFYGCRSLTSVTIPDGVTSIGKYAFCGCSSLTSVTIGNSVTSIGDYAFYGCSSLPTIVIPDGVPSIGERAFYECSNLTSIKLPENLSSIGTYAFYQCYDLQSVVIPEGVTTIGSYAFSNCTYLTSVTLPSTLTSIGDHAFYGSIRLTEVINHSGFSLTCGSDEYGYVAAYAMEIHQGESKIDNQEGYLFYPYGGINYLIAYIGSDTNLTLPQSYRGEAYEITSVTFFGCTHLTSITIPNGTITRIPDPMTIHSEGFISVPFGAFVGCNSLTNISIGNGVTSIGMCAFYSCTSLTSITIPDSVTTIGDGAFYNCSSLTSIWIGKGVTSIGESVFFKCVALTDIQVHQDNPSYQSIDGHLYTKDGTTLIKYAVGNAQTSFVVPDSVTSIIGGAFDGNETLASITLPFVGATKDGTENTKFMYIFGNSVPSSLKTVIITGGTTIAAEAFYNCYTLTSITIPHTVTSIGAGAFSGCSSLESITLPFIGSSVTVEIDSPNAQFGYVFGETTSGTTQHYKPSSGGYAYAKTYRIPSTLKSVTVLGGSLSYCAFENCINLTTVTLGDAVTSIGNLAFKNCSNLTSVTIGNGVTSIGDDAFYGCGGLTSITIPDSVTSIGSSAFYNCSSLTSVTIGKGVISDNLNFSSCGNLTSITVDPNNTVYQSIDGNLYTKDGTTLIRYAVGKTATTFVIPDSVTSIGASAFATCSSLTSITIPDGVTIIGTSAFANCSSLTSITIPSGVTGIGASTFANCSSLTSITIPDSVTAIGNQAFSGCGNLTSVVIGKNVKQIGRYAFEMCYNLTSVSFENNFWRWYVTQTPPLNTTYDTAIRQDALKISSTAAKYLWSNYCNYYWIRND